MIINTEATWIWVPDDAGLFSLERNWWRTLVLKYRSLRSSRGMSLPRSLRINDNYVQARSSSILLKTKPMSDILWSVLYNKRYMYSSRLLVVLTRLFIYGDTSRFGVIEYSKVCVGGTEFCVSQRETVE